MSRLAGYAWLIERHRLVCLRPHHESRIAQGPRHTIESARRVTDQYPVGYEPEATDLAHLEFALRYDGVELGVLVALMRRWDPAPLVQALAERPHGKELRRLWFLFEWLTGQTLPVADMINGNYINLLDPTTYFTTKPWRSRRHRVDINLLGTRAWCPVVRRTRLLAEFAAEDFPAEVRRRTSDSDPSLLLRAITYLYTAETKSSFQLEREEPTEKRKLRFIALLREAHTLKIIDKAALLRLHGVIKAPDAIETDYRHEQNYVGGRGVLGQVAYVPPPHECVPEMMDALLGLCERLTGDDVPVEPVVAAAVVAFSFVYIHPFKDGNGRIHRFLIHYVLSHMGFTPSGAILPVSAAIQRDQAGYMQALNDFEPHMLDSVRYFLDDDGAMTLKESDPDLYRFVDMTAQAEALCRWIRDTVRHDIPKELLFLRRYDRAIQLMRRTIEMQDRLEDVFINVCLRNGYKLSKAKRETPFSMLSEPQITALEHAVKQAFTEVEAGRGEESAAEA